LPGPGLALVFVAVGLAGTWGVAGLQGRAGWLDQLLPALGALAWIGPAYAVASRQGRDPLLVHGVLVRPRGLALAVAVSSVILLGYAGAWVATQGAPQPGWAGAPAFLVYQLAFVALPEEYFFRGVLQPAWERRWTGGPTVLGGRLGGAALGAAAVFALCHLVRPGIGFAPAALLTVFPAIWFAWLRARTGSVLPGIACHALANLLEALLRGQALS
jgi:membrane protease YdiL (CAAX protease family)